MEDKRPWLKHYPPEIPESITYNKKPLHSFLLESGKRFKNKKAVHFMGKELSFGQILSEALRKMNLLYVKVAMFQRGKRLKWN